MQEILTKLWCAVDAEDVTEKLIDVGAIDDAQTAIAELVEGALPEKLDEDPDLEDVFARGYDKAVDEIRNNLIKAGVLK